MSGPAIPLRTSARTSLIGPKERNRRSLPASALKDARRSSNHVIVKPASTEVISSLIHTLSAISSPVQDHFDAFPDTAGSLSTPVSPNSWATDCSALGAGATGHRHSYLLRSKNTSVRAIANASDRRGSSLLAVKTAEDESGIEGVGIEPHSPTDWQPATSRSPPKVQQAKDSRSSRSLKSLGLKVSKDSPHFPGVPPRPRSPRSPVSPRVDSQELGMGYEQERIFISDFRSPSPPFDRFDSRLKIPKRYSRSRSSEFVIPKQPCGTTHEIELPKRLFLTGDEIFDGPSTSNRSSFHMPSQDIIPKRNSSMRHSHTFTPQDRTRLSRTIQPETAASEAVKTAVEEALNSDVDAPDLSVVSDASFLTAPQTPTPAPETTEEGVVQRIKELKEQKEQRDRLSMGGGPEELAQLKDPTRTPSPMSASTHPPAALQPPKADIPIDAELPKITGDVPQNPNQDPPAPPPTIRTAPLRIDQAKAGESKDKPSTLMPPNPKPRPVTPSDDSRSAPQRRYSRLQKRVSTSTGPEAEQKHRRRFSTPVPPVLRIPSFQSDGKDPVDEAVEDYLAAPRLSQVARTPSGRLVSFSEVGDPIGSVVFCCVGMGLTRFLTAFYDELAASLNLRLITLDRPGVGGSEPHTHGYDTPLGWPDDVRSICEHLHITKFSILAHSAGAIYALATALRMPQHIRCRVHLLAPWIPPSQLSTIGSHQEPLPTSALPYSQRFLRSLPTPFLRAANSSFLQVTSNSITTSLPRSPIQNSRRLAVARNDISTKADLSPARTESASMPTMSLHTSSPTPDPRDATTLVLSHRSASTLDNVGADPHATVHTLPINNPASTTIDTLVAGQAPVDSASSPDYKSRLTSAIWDAATTNANAAVDLIVCLERKQPIGFRYIDITRAVIIHHGSKDNRVPVENVRWLGKMMRRCEVRVLEGQGHGLMASAAVMGNVLEEMSGEWEDWLRVVNQGRKAGAGSP